MEPFENYSSMSLGQLGSYQFPVDSELADNAIFDDETDCTSTGYDSGEIEISEIEDVRKFQNENFPDVQEADAILAREMANLSVKERSQVLEDLHGVCEDVVETPELLSKGLLELNVEVEKIEDKEAYNTALTMDPGYVQNDDFRLKFLRADLFVAEKAAKRLVLHFEMKLELFPKEKLAKDIQLDDFSEEGIKCLYDGSMQSLPFRDRAGRAVSVWFPYFFGKEKIHEYRRTFYLGLVAAEDLETQRKGVIVVSWWLGKRGFVTSDSDSIKYQTRLAGALPVRVAAQHTCYDNPIMLPFYAALKVYSNWYCRFRLRSHYGNHLQCKITLQQFGIPVHQLPVETSGEPITKWHLEYMRKRRKYERQVEHGIKNVVLIPGKSDVLLGRGQTLQDHTGNQTFRDLIDSHMAEYSRATSKHEKARLVVQIVETINRMNGRFFKDTDVGWLEVGEQTAREKTSHSLRDRRREYLRKLKAVEKNKR